MTSNVVKPTTPTTCDKCKRTIPAGEEVLAVALPGAVLVFCCHASGGDAERDGCYPGRTCGLHPHLTPHIVEALVRGFRPGLALDAPAPRPTAAVEAPVAPAPARWCSLCRCEAEGELYGLPVCSYHGSHGEDAPACPKCAGLRWVKGHEAPVPVDQAVVDEDAGEDLDEYIAEVLDALTDGVAEDLAKRAASGVHNVPAALDGAL